MSTLTSSAVGSSKAKPKAPPRRRAPGVVPTASLEQTSSQPAQLVSTSHGKEVISGAEVQDTLPPPSPPVVVERPLKSSYTQTDQPLTTTAADQPPPTTAAQQAPPTTTADQSLPTSAIEQPLHISTAEQSLPTSSSSSEQLLHAHAAEQPLRTPPASQNQSQQSHTVSNDHTNSSTGAAQPVLHDVSPIVVENLQDKSTQSRKRTRRMTQRTTSNKRSRRDEADIDTTMQAEIADMQAVTNTVQSEPDSTVQSQEATSEQQTRRSSRRKTASEKATISTDKPPRVRKPRQPKKPTIATAKDQSNDLINTGEEANTIPAPAKSRKRVTRRKKAVVATEVGQDVQAEAEDASDPEAHQIDPKTLSMYDLTHDTRRGRVSEREKKMAQIDWAAVKARRREEADAIMRGEVSKEKTPSNVMPSTEVGDEQAEENESRPQAVTRGSGMGVKFRLVGGQIVEDESSLTIDRAARLAEAAAQDADAPVEEENDLTIRFNRTTYINARKRDETERLPLWRAKSDAWTEEETDRFYDALRMFGTDFFIISKMFPPKTRKQIKLKFVREERLEPDRINATLLGIKTEKIDLNHYAQAINRDVNDFHKYDGLAHANEVIKASMKDKEEAMRAAVKEDEENNRQREVQRQQREKSRLETEKKKEERARKKSARRRGDVWGAGTLGGADDADGDAA